MFNITVINLKKLIKRILVIVVILILVFIFIKFSNDIFKNCFSYINKKYENIVKLEMSFSDYEIINFEKGLEKILSSELVAINQIECRNSTRTESKNIENSNDKLNENKVEEANNTQENITVNTDSSKKIDFKNLKTQVVKEKNIKETYNVQYNTVKIKNESTYALTQEMLTPNVEYTNKKDIIIYHTHTCESYTPTEKYSYKATGNYRTTDLNFTVSKVADVLTNCLINKEYNVIHDSTYHDYPAYTGSYSRSLVTATKILKNNPEVQTVIDLHRDAIGNNSDYGPAVMIGEEKVAQLMFVIGTNGGGLEHSDWNTNLKYAIKIQEKANELFPGLFRPIIVRDSRYNQHLSDSAFIIEVGATGNTLEECEGAMKYLAEVISQVM